MTAQEFLRANITTLIAVLDEHEAGINEDGTYRCRTCLHRMTPAEWEQHLADAMSDKVAPVGELTLL